MENPILKNYEQLENKNKHRKHILRDDKGKKRKTYDMRTSEIHITLPNWVIAEIDKQRITMNRSSFIRHLIEPILKNNINYLMMEKAIVLRKLNYIDYEIENLKTYGSLRRQLLRLQNENNEPGNGHI